MRGELVQRQPVVQPLERQEDLVKISPYSLNRLLRWDLPSGGCFCGQCMRDEDPDLLSLNMRGY